MKDLNSSSQPNTETRRSFIKKAATATAVVSASGFLKTPVYGQSQAPSTGRVIGANDRIAVAYIGTGSQGRAHIRHQKRNANDNNIVQAAVCDLYKKRLQQAQETIGLNDADTYGDHRKLLERKDIDAVVVSTVDVWHAPVAIDAMDAGKHVYGEKPMSRYLMEGFDMYDKVKASGKVFQIGSQYCADPMFHKAAEWIKQGKLGPLVWGQGSYCRNNPKNSEWTYPVDRDVSENNLDWKRWLGKARQIPFNPNHYFSWHKYYAYNSGILGNLLPHKFLPMMLATGNPEFPRRICCSGTRKVSTDREITDTTHLLAEFPSGFTTVVAGSTVNEQGLADTLRGQHATLHLSSSQNKVELKPERPYTDEIDAETFSDPRRVGDVPRLEKNWFDCIRSGATPLANIDLSIRAHTVLCLAEQSERMGLTLFFDEKTRTIHTGDGKVVPALTYGNDAPMST
jgi:predicted dehydrogenase